MTDRPLQAANNRSGAVVDAATAGDPQWVTRRGKPTVVVPAVEEYKRLRHLEKAKAPTFADLLLAMPQDDEEFERPSLPPRSADSRCSWSITVCCRPITTADSQTIAAAVNERRRTRRRLGVACR